MLTQSIGKHDEYIADLMLRMTALESRQETTISEHVDDVKAAVVEQMSDDTERSFKALTGRLNVFDTILRDVIKVQRDLVRDVSALRTADHQVQMSRDIVDLQQMVTILKRKRLQGTVVPSHPVRIPTNNVPLVDFKNGAVGDRSDAFVVSRITELEQSFEVLSLMHGNLRSELARMNLVDA